MQCYSTSVVIEPRVYPNGGHNCIKGQTWIILSKSKTAHCDALERDAQEHTELDEAADLDECGNGCNQGHDSNFETKDEAEAEIEENLKLHTDFDQSGTTNRNVAPNGNDNVRKDRHNRLEDNVI